MKSQLPVTILCIVLLSFFGSCNRSVHDGTAVSNPLIGKWKVDSFVIGKDTSLGAVLALVSLHYDTAGITFEFNASSIITCATIGNDTIAYTYDAEKNNIIAQGSKGEVYYYYQRSQTLSSLTSKNGHTFFIKRK